MADQLTETQRLDAASAHINPPIAWVVGAPVPAEAMPLIEDVYRIGSRQIIVDDAAPVRDWYVVKTAPMLERTAASGLKEIGIRSYYPKLRRWRPVKKPKPGQPRKVVFEAPLFVSYIFAGFVGFTHPDWRRVCNIDGVSGVLGFDGVPHPLKKMVVEKIMREDAEGRYDETRRLPWKPAKGQTVRVIDGPFAGFTGDLTHIKGEERVKLLIGMFGQFTPVTLDFKQIEAV